MLFGYKLKLCYTCRVGFQSARRLTIAVLLLASSDFLQAETVHLLQASLLGGQHFFEGENSSLAGNFNIFYSPTYTLSEKWTLVGIYQGTYRGTKEVADLAGGGTLFRELANSRVGVRAIRKLSDKWSIKGMGGGKTELLKETKDETWMKGLFDYRKADAGLEVERRIEKGSAVRLNYSYFGLWFPNYESLESKTNLGRELAGKDTLDSSNHLATLEWEMPVNGLGSNPTIINLSGSNLLRHYPDQRTLLASGNYSTTKREDKTIYAGLNIKRPFALGANWGAVPFVGTDWAQSDSNQSHQDANLAKFLPNYYDYSELRPSAGASFIWGNDPKTAKIFSFSSWYANRQYDQRLAQDVNGSYLTEKVWLKSLGVSLSASWPVGTQGTSLRALVSTVSQDSNMKYEAVYRYNFSSANYLLGFSWELK